jgi:hypothetical protein
MNETAHKSSSAQPIRFLEGEQRSFLNPFSADLDAGIYVSVVRNFLDLLAAQDRFDSPLHEGPKYSSLSEALAEHTEVEPQMAKDLAWAALTPLREETQRLVVEVNRESQMARLAIREQTAGR